MKRISQKGARWFRYAAVRVYANVPRNYADCSLKGEDVHKKGIDTNLERTKIWHEKAISKGYTI